MQLAGSQLSNTSALVGNDIATFPDFPAEIRAPRGTKAGVSGFQIHFASQDIFTPGDTLDATATVTEIHDGLVDLAVETKNQNGVTVVSGTAQARIDP